MDINELRELRESILSESSSGGKVFLSTVITAAYDPENINDKKENPPRFIMVEYHINPERDQTFLDIVVKSYVGKSDYYLPPALPNNKVYEDKTFGNKVIKAAEIEDIGVTLDQAPNFSMSIKAKENWLIETYKDSHGIRNIFKYMAHAIPGNWNQSNFNTHKEAFDFFN